MAEAPGVADVWQRNWERVIPFFQLRKLSQFIRGASRNSIRQQTKRTACSLAGRFVSPSAVSFDSGWFHCRRLVFLVPQMVRQLASQHPLHQCFGDLLQQPARPCKIILRVHAFQQLV